MSLAFQASGETHCRFESGRPLQIKMWRIAMEIKDVRNLQEELKKAMSEMVLSFEGQTGCIVKELNIRRSPSGAWDVIVDVIVEV